MAVRQDASTGQLTDDGKSGAAVDASGRQTMQAKVYSPYHSYFDGPAYSISAVNATGPFDILPKHHNFMTLLLPCIIDIQTSTGAQKIKISRGIMHVKADKVVVFLDV
jgi:F0F1-type ATP synthase epsilon subunit